MEAEFDKYLDASTVGMPWIVIAIARFPPKPADRGRWLIRSRARGHAANQGPAARNLGTGGGAP